MARSSARPSLMGRIFSTLTFVERRELPSVVAAFFLFFCVLGGYFAVRPVRETVGTILGRDRVANLWLATWIVSLAIVPIYGWIVAKIRRSVFLPLIYGFVAVALAIVGAVLQAQPKSVAVAQFFYVFITPVTCTADDANFWLRFQFTYKIAKQFKTGWIMCEVNKKFEFSEFK